jgi:hypothetical protein
VDATAATCGGNTGKGDAFTYLFNGGAVLDGVDLSCQATGNWNTEPGVCAKEQFSRVFN